MNKIEFAEFERERDENLELMKRTESPVWRWSHLPMVQIPFKSEKVAIEFYNTMVSTGRYELMREVVDMFFETFKDGYSGHLMCRIEMLDGLDIAGIIGIQMEYNGKFVQLFKLSSDEKNVEWNPNIFNNRIIDQEER